MRQKIFQSTHPILLANMNKGTVLPLSVAVHNAGGYASLCSWTYGENLQFMQSDLEKFIQATGSSNINLSFEASLITEPERVLDIIKTFKIPTIEVIYGHYLTTTFWMSMSPEEIDRKIKSALEPIHNLGVKIFKRALEPHTPEQMHRHFIDGFMIKGSDGAGAANQNYTVKELFLQQKKLTPDAYLVPYGGVGTADQVREYLELGAETVGIGTLFAASEESLLKYETKLAMIKSSSKNLKTLRKNQMQG
jgi:NAD(P)H-dependent flavin oxidoreductase YrpB (nitropropane dioxygenase family)